MPRRCPKLGSNVATSSPARCSGKFPKGRARGSHAELAPHHGRALLPHALPLSVSCSSIIVRPSSSVPRSLPALSLGPLSRPLSRLRADTAMAGSRQSVVQLRPPPAATTSQAMARRSTWLAAALPLTAGAACACRTHLRCCLFCPLLPELVAWSRWPGRPLPRPRTCLGKPRPRRSPPTPLPCRPSWPPAGHHAVICVRL